MRLLRLAPAALALLALPAGAQHAGHREAPSDSAPRRVGWHLGAVPELVRATPTAGRRSLTEGYLAHPVAMLHGTTRGGALSLHLMANLEGLTLRRGELATGVYGEGYVDRRHPHSYLHEAIVTASHRVGRANLSLAAGRGFAPFGSDDPMVRPFARYPVNHHHAQVLERLVLVGAARVGTLTAEAGLLNGDEPTSPSSAPRYRRFGDSWTGRVTWRPLAAAPEALELSASHGRLRSPEDPTTVTGLDQRKWHAGARVTRETPLGLGYLLAEWALTDDYAGRRHVFRYGSALVEAMACGRAGRVALRAERTARHEEERLFDLFRTPVPHAESSIIGITRWTTLGVHAGTREWRRGVVRAVPFVEATWLRPEPALRNAAFEPVAFYGARDLWQLSVGARLGAGMPHGRMGRYGVAEAPAAAGQHGNRPHHDRRAGC